MAPPKGAVKGGIGKGKKVAGAKSNNKDEENPEETLQAVILADDFGTRFRPLTDEKPRCLLPLANTPLLDYTLEWLATSGVKEVYIYPGPETADEVESYIRSSKWNPRSGSSSFDVAEVIISKSTSIGEAMRDLDRRQVMSGDFLVVHGDMICNVPITDILQKHKARRAKDKNAIMTVLVGNGGEETGPSIQSNTPVFVVDRSGRCLYYEEINPLKDDKRIRLPSDVLSSNADLEFRSDLVDCGIDICTPDVLGLWTDEFDYQEPRQFLHGVLKDYELNGKTVYIDTLYEYYSARVNNLQAYDNVTRDLLFRYTFPLVPDTNILPDQTYKVTANGVIKEDGVVISRGCRIGENTIVGNETSLGDGTQINNSTIGRRCQIGKNVTIQDAYIWDDVMIGDGAHIEKSIIASEAAIGSNAKIMDGTIISFGVRIAPNFTVKGGSRITLGNREFASSKRETDVAVVGEGGSGYLFVDDDEPTGEKALQLFRLQNSLIYNMGNLNFSTDSISTLGSEITGAGSSTPTRRFSSGSYSDDDPSGFHHDAVQGLYDTLQESGDFDSAKLEFMGLRLSNNATDTEIRHAIAGAFTKSMVTLVTEEKLDPVKSVKRSLDTRGATQFLKEVGIGKTMEVGAQVEFLLEVQKYLSPKNSGSEILFAFCHELYEREVIEEEGFEAWWDSKNSVATEEMVRVRVKAEAFLTWLKEAEEEDSDEDDDDDEDEDEDESD